MLMRALAFLCWVGIAAAQGTLARIEGRLLDTVEQPLRGAIVRLTRDVPLVTRGSVPTTNFSPPTTVTNAEGRFELSAPVPGRYLVRAERAGYVPLREGVPVEVEAGGTVAVTIRLAPQSVIEGRVTEEPATQLRERRLLLLVSSLQRVRGNGGISRRPGQTIAAFTG